MTSIGSGSIPALKLERRDPLHVTHTEPRIWFSRSHLILTSRALLTRTCKVQRSPKDHRTRGHAISPEHDTRAEALQHRAPPAQRGAVRPMPSPARYRDSLLQPPPSRPSGSSLVRCALAT